MAETVAAGRRLKRRREPASATSRSVTGVPTGRLGVWWIIASTAAIKGVLLILWFRRGKWKTRCV